MSKISKLYKDKKHRGKFFRKELKILKFKYCLFNSKDDKQKSYYLYKFICCSLCIIIYFKSSVNCFFCF